MPLAPRAAVETGQESAHRSERQEDHGASPEANEPIASNGLKPDSDQATRCAVMNEPASLVPPSLAIGPHEGKPLSFDATPDEARRGGDSTAIRDCTSERLHDVRAVERGSDDPYGLSVHQDGPRLGRPSNIASSCKRNPSCHVRRVSFNALLGREQWCSLSSP